MSEQNPWRAPQDTPPPSRRPFLLFLLLFALGGVGLFALMQFFPGWQAGREDTVSLLYGLLILAFVASSVAYASRFRLGELLRNALIWCGVLAVLAAGFVYQHELRDFGARVMSELNPSRPMASGEKTMVLTESAGGHFFVHGRIDNVPVLFLIDTGATDIVLSPSDATRIGIDLASLNFDRISQTANGLGLGASSTVKSLDIGPVQWRDVSLTINRAEMGTSLLGMSFLRRMAGIEIRGRQMFLHWKQ